MLKYFPEEKETIQKYCDEVVATCDSFNKLEKELHFAKIYIVENVLVCNNIHPFQEIKSLTELFSAHIIHNWKIRECSNKYG